VACVWRVPAAAPDREGCARRRGCLLLHYLLPLSGGALPLTPRSRRRGGSALPRDPSAATLSATRQPDGRNLPGGQAGEWHLPCVGGAPWCGTTALLQAAKRCGGGTPISLHKRLLATSTRLRGADACLQHALPGCASGTWRRRAFCPLLRCTPSSAERGGGACCAKGGAWLRGRTRTGCSSTPLCLFYLSNMACRALRMAFVDALRAGGALPRGACVGGGSAGARRNGLAPRQRGIYLPCLLPSGR